MKCKLSILSFLLFSKLIFSQCNTNLGVYYWGGQITGVDTSVIIPTAKKLADSLGVNTIRIALVSNDDEVYKNGDSCLLGMNLTTLASRPDFNAIITDPKFSTVIFTAYDWASFADCNTQNFLDSTFYTPANTAAIELEFTNFATYLKQFTTKTFIITNWEGDNAVYGGAAYSDPNYPQAPANIVGFKKWMLARSAGISAANAPNVKFGIEFCNIHSLQNLGKPSILNNVIPYVNADYFLYSAYESFNISTNQLDSDINFVRNKLIGFGKNPNALLIGEMGFGKNDWGSAANAADSLQKTINVVIQKQLPYAIAWTLIDTPTNFGMYDSIGLISPQGTVLKNSVCQTTAINTINDNEMKLQVYPNPNTGSFNLNFNSSIVNNINLEITEAIGQTFYTEQIKNFQGNYVKEFDFNNISSGIYYLQLKSEKNILTQKIVVFNK
jgi:type IX secretion system substrate protein